MQLWIYDNLQKSKLQNTHFRLLCENFIGHSGSGSWSNQKTYFLTMIHFSVLQPILGDKF